MQTQNRILTMHDFLVLWHDKSCIGPWPRLNKPFKQIALSCSCFDSVCDEYTMVLKSGEIDFVVLGMREACGVVATALVRHTMVSKDLFATAAKLC
jgi:hypothetical protein